MVETYYNLQYREMFTHFNYFRIHSRSHVIEKMKVTYANITTEAEDPGFIFMSQ
jgi:hypothetical protein